MRSPSDAAWAIGLPTCSAKRGWCPAPPWVVCEQVAAGFVEDHSPKRLASTPVAAGST